MDSERIERLTAQVHEHATELEALKTRPRASAPTNRLFQAVAAMQGLLLLGVAGSAVAITVSEPVADEVAPTPEPVPLPTPEPPPPVAVPEPEPEAPVATTSVPGARSVDRLPHVDQGTTAGSPTRRIATYPCGPGVDEGGPEVWYQVQVDRAGVLVASIVEDSNDGVDVDVHLLDSPEAEGCIARGHAAARAEVQPGTWWVVVDTYVASGLELAGPYDLRITLE